MLHANADRPRQGTVPGPKEVTPEMVSAIRQAIDAMNADDLDLALEILEPHQDPDIDPRGPEHLISYATAARDWVTLACDKLRRTLNKDSRNDVKAIVPIGLALRTALALLVAPDYRDRD